MKYMVSIKTDRGTFLVDEYQNLYTYQVCTTDNESPVDVMNMKLNKLRHDEPEFFDDLILIDDKLDKMGESRRYQRRWAKRGHLVFIPEAK